MASPLMQQMASRKPASVAPEVEEELPVEEEVVTTDPIELYDKITEEMGQLLEVASPDVQRKLTQVIKQFSSLTDAIKGAGEGDAMGQQPMVEPAR